MTDEITDREFTAMLIGSRENVLPTELMIHVHEEGGILTQEQREKVERLNNCATSAMDGLISSMKGFSALMSRASINDLERGESIDVTWLGSILGDLINGTYLLEANTRDILHRSELNEMKGAVRAVARISELDEPEVAEESSATAVG